MQHEIVPDHYLLLVNSKKFSQYFQETLSEIKYILKKENSLILKNPNSIFVSEPSPFYENCYEKQK